MIDRSPDRARADTRLAWLIVGASAAVMLVLVALFAAWGIDRLEESMQRQQRSLIAEREAARRQNLDVILPTPSTPPPPDTARPIGSPARWLDADDYPSGARRRGEEGRVRVTLAIDRDGRPTGCSVTLSSGSGSLDNGTCTALMAKGRFDAAPDGPMVRRWTSPPIRWVLPR